MISFEIGGRRYQVVLTHEEGSVELAIRHDDRHIAAMHIDERGVSSVMIEQCLVVPRR